MQIQHTLSIIKKGFLAIVLLLFTVSAAIAQARNRVSFNEGWKFFLGDNENAKDPSFDDTKWRRLTLPHDWSIEGTFDEKNPAKPEGGGLPTGIGWYRKSFVIPVSSASKIITVV
jgi:beta-galactosidase